MLVVVITGFASNNHYLFCSALIIVSILLLFHASAQVFSKWQGFFQG